MVSTSKILTVSYGTFSCTLEGFDDSFETMKAIAEYFRDLASDDRYFGAEPPTPDADMLARIAEREISRRVEAHGSGGKVHLRSAPSALSAISHPAEQHGEQTQPESAEFNAADTHASASGTAPQPTSAPETPAAAPVARAVAKPQSYSTPEGASESIADKLRRIRAVTSPGASAFPASDFEDDADSQDFLTSMPTDLTDDADAAEVQPDAADTGGDSLAAADAAAFDDASILSRLSATEGEADGAEEEPHTDETLIAAAPDDADDDDDALDFLLGDWTQDDDEPAQPDDQDDDIEADEPTAQADAETATHPLGARVVKIKQTALDTALAGGNLEEELDTAQRDSALTNEAEADLQRELAKVEAELQHARVPETEIPHPYHTAAEDAAPVDDAQAEDAPETEARDTEGADRTRHIEQPKPDTQAGRIFDEADTQLGEPESNKRRSAIQHLRAAVAATLAERRAGGSMPQGTDDQPYRKDLQSVVRPRRPQALGSATPRPAQASSSRPAPLKLVAEQRVDIPTQPVRPRRITRADLTATATRPEADSTEDQMGDEAPNDGFADYADQVGANSLTDLLEAAAAYMSDVEGTPQFSRPMLMQKLREVHEDDFSREEGLRSFGLLLRQGKLQKLKGGRFAVTDVTEFRRSA